MNPSTNHVWKFFRTGGLDQVKLETGADLLALEQLDQELWVALGCPVKGLQIDEKTLSLIDTDKDGRISAPDVIAAIKWAAARLRDPGELLSGSDGLPLASINSDTAEGKVMLASARQIVSAAGRPDAAEVTVADATNSAQLFAGSALNGDGIIPPEATSDPTIQTLIKEVIGSVGGVARPNGRVGITAEKIEAFYAELAAYAGWAAKGDNGLRFLGETTAQACAALRAVRPKVDDYFARTRLVAFDSRAQAVLNRSEADYLTVAAQDMKLTVDEVRGFPLARVEPDKPLPLLEGVNPAWAMDLTTLHAKVVAPVFGAAKTSLSAAEWAALNAKFAEYEAWLEGKTGAAVEKLGLNRAQQILAGNGRAALSELIARDKVLEPEFKAVGDVERLARYRRDLKTLVHNFVNFADFYSPDRYATFQAGTLYLDSRSTELCIRVDGPNPLAAMSKAYIAYCSCTPAGGGAPMTIAACFTQGDSDYLFVGRNGIFYDRQGKLWYAIITSIVDNPISIRQAFWSPYKKFLRMIEEQVAKRAAAADTAASARLASAAEKAANADKAKAEPAKKFDLALITGIGVAIGSIGTFFSMLFAKFVDVPGWQLPLILVGLILVISLPSMLIAALKLRQRNLGPILEGNGWAINGRVKINIPFGAALTKMATLPPGAQRSLKDPYEDKEAKRQKRRAILITVLIALVAGSIWVRYDYHRNGKYYFWQSKPVKEEQVKVLIEQPPAK